VEEYVLYELHVGTFTEAGTFEAAIQHLPYFKSLGVTAVEVMPVAQFPGSRNWGYDGVYPFAVQNSYGGPTGFKRFIDAAHANGLAVVLDVVYNHLGPEGNYLGQFGPYFTDKYQTPWGSAINFDGVGAEAVRDYFIHNALYWVRDFHIDGLRLDAVHAIFDSSSTHILSDIAVVLHDFAQDQERTVAVIAESDLNEARLVQSGELGGYGLDAQWSDDFHHAIHTVLTGERAGYYEDFGRVEDVAKALAGGFVYSGQYSSHRGKCHGTDCTDVPGRAFVVCVQNHDQIGNRMLGERLSHIVEFDQLKIAAGMLLLSPYVPLLFMGQEYAETAPFLYFVSHSDPELVAAVRKGRQSEFASFSWKGAVPDAQEESTFLRSKLNHDLRAAGRHAVLTRWYGELLRMRASHPALKTLNRRTTAVELAGDGHTVVMRRWNSDVELLGVFHLSKTASTVELEVRQQNWVKLLNGSDPAWLGSGSAVPDSISAESGRIRLSLHPYQCLVVETSRDTVPQEGAS
jgi:maltooligosyltrehalose trehalohydrolase